MKVSKIILASMLGVAILGSAGADEYDGPRNRCKAKTDWYWVENTKTCVPNNPCKDEKYDKYCSRFFTNFEAAGTAEYLMLVDIYAGTYNLDCRAVSTDENLIGKDFVWCKGNDAKMFEFSDIDDNNWTDTMDTYCNKKLSVAICSAAGGTWSDGWCRDINQADCNSIQNIFNERISAADYKGSWCHFSNDWWTDKGCLIQFDKID